MGNSVNRRLVLAGFGAAAMPAPLPAMPAIASRATTLLSRPIAGLAYYEYPRLAAQLVAGTPVVLQREPANPNDAKAIAVLTNRGAKLGYVPRVDNEPITSLMDAGYKLRAEIVKSDRRHGLICG